MSLIKNYKKETLYLKNKYKDKINLYPISHSYNVEIISCNASKLIAINKIIEIEKIKKENVYTIGDDISDLETIKNYNGFSINSSINDVKNISNGSFNHVYELINKINKI